jgi:uncharacterized membrane protein
VFGLGDLKEVAQSGIHAERNTPAGYANAATIMVLGGIVIARNISLPDAAVAIAGIIAGRPVGAFEPPGFKETLLLVGVVVIVGLICVAGLGFIEVRKHDSVARALGINRRRKRAKRVRRV